jgi:AcrR family transcriptional regulator
LSQEAIVDAAIKVLDRDGADAVSMRNVARELNAGAASLYWHVAGKDELVNLVIDRAAGELDLPAPNPARWQEQLQEAAHQELELLLRHRDLARLRVGRIPIGPKEVRWLEWSLRLLRSAGIPDRQAVLFGDLFHVYIGHYAFERSLEAPAQASGNMPVNATRETVRDYLASLPRQQFPNITSMVDEIVAPDLDRRFEFGLDLILKGLESYARPTDREEVDGA